MTLSSQWLQTVQHNQSPPALKRFKLLADRIAAVQDNTPTEGNPAEMQLTKYIQELQGGLQVPDTWLENWNSRHAIYSSIAPIAEDLFSAPASEAFVECIFSVAGLQSAGQKPFYKRIPVTCVSEVEQ